MKLCAQQNLIIHSVYTSFQREMRDYLGGLVERNKIVCSTTLRERNIGGTLLF
jgi:hypothetical protein